MDSLVKYKRASKVTGSLFTIGILRLLAYCSPFEAQYQYQMTLLVVILGAFFILGYKNGSVIEAKKSTLDDFDSSSVRQLVNQLEELGRYNTYLCLDELVVEKIVYCLNKLAMHCSNRHTAAIMKNSQNGSDMNQQMDMADTDDTMDLLTQEAAFITLQRFSSSDVILCAVLSILALVAGNIKVRERSITETDTYGIHIPISAIQSSLLKAKSATDPTEKEEQLSAEVQIKGCLFLGAMADGNAILTRHLIDKDGLRLILEASDWYRLHSEVAKWSLWAIFVLCYDHPGNKMLLIQLDGLRKICQILREITDHVDVTRHGIAILFDCMRENAIDENVDIVKLRRMAINEGLQDILLQALVEFPQSTEITLMGKQMLQATGYVSPTIHDATVTIKPVD